RAETSGVVTAVPRDLSALLVRCRRRRCAEDEREGADRQSYKPDPQPCWTHLATACAVFDSMLRHNARPSDPDPCPTDSSDGGEVPASRAIGCGATRARLPALRSYRQADRAHRTPTTTEQLRVG